MIGVEEAKRIILARARPTATHQLPLDEAGDAWSARDIVSPHDHPRFDMSAVDGFAVNGPGPSWPVVHVIAAGEVMDRPLRPGECARIFTGAMVPDGTTTIVMQEHGHHQDGTFQLSAPPPKDGANIRRRAESIHAGETIIRAGARFNAASAGMCASVGIERVEVHLPPQVAVVRTGNEFLDHGAGAGRIFSSNDVMLLAALRSEGIVMDHGFTAMDDARDLRQTLQEAIVDHDVIITTGGVSVGDHDLIADVLAELGASIHVHGVAQKPGKPMLFATLDGKPVFGLPGNPRAVMVLYWEYVLPFLHAMRGAADPWLKSDRLPLAHPVAVKGDRAEFRAAKVNGGKVTLPADEGSHMLRSLIDADALAYLPSSKRAWAGGETVEIHFLPH